MTRDDARKLVDGIVTLAEGCEELERELNRNTDVLDAMTRCVVELVFAKRYQGLNLDPTAQTCEPTRRKR